MKVAFSVASLLALCSVALASDRSLTSALRPMDYVPMPETLVPVVKREADIVPMSDESPMLLELRSTNDEWEVLNAYKKPAVFTISECVDDFMPTWTLGGCEWIEDAGNCTKSGMFWYYESYKNVYAKCGWNDGEGVCKYDAGTPCAVTFYNPPAEAWWTPEPTDGDYSGSGSSSSSSSSAAAAPAPAPASFMEQMESSTERGLIVHLNKEELDQPEEQEEKPSKKTFLKTIENMASLKYYLS